MEHKKMTSRHELTPADILPWAEYAKDRAEHRKRLTAIKRNRRVEVGPYVTFYFENFDTMWIQVQEMLHIEKGGEAQIADELAAYNPLVPKGKELVATFMIEIDDALRRARVLSQLGGVEETASIEVGGERVVGKAEQDQDRTTAEGKASSVQFVHFPFTDAQIAAFREPNTRVILGLSHPNYSHMAVLSEATRAALAEDFSLVRRSCALWRDSINSPSRSCASNVGRRPLADLSTLSAALVPRRASAGTAGERAETRRRASGPKPTARATVPSPDNRS